MVLRQGMDVDRVREVTRHGLMYEFWRPTRWQDEHGASDERAYAWYRNIVDQLYEALEAEEAVQDYWRTR